MKSFISTKTYGFFNYAIAIVMIASPWLFGFQHQHGVSLLLPLYLGWLELIMAIFSNHELGFVKQFPVSMHCFIDVVFGFFLAMTPFIYGYTYEVFVPQMCIGILLFVFGLYTRTSPFRDEPRHVFKDGLMEHKADIDEPMAH